jgi:predicted alpha-1,6-mannanase (GH76 family)
MRRVLVAVVALSLAWTACSDDGAPSGAPGLGGPATDAGAGGDAAAVEDAGDGGDAAADVGPLHDAADRALEAMMLGFWSGSDSYLRAERGPTKLTGYWTFAQALDAVLDGVERTGGRYAGLLETFYLSQDAIGWSRDFFDDENWMALALLRAFDLTGTQKYLVEARALLDDIVQNATDSSCCGATPGGLWWDRPHTQKATAANAGAVVTAVRAWQRTGNTSYLDFAKTVWAYWDAHMVDKATHAVFDHIAAPSGNVVKYKFTYNEGLMIGASLALDEATKDPKYLAEAHAIAGYMVGSETVATPYGRVLFDGAESACTGDCPQFKGIGYRYLAALHAKDPRPDYAEVLKASEQSLVAVARDPATGLFGVDWSMPPGTLYVESSSSAAAALSIFARAAGPYPKPPTPNVYQAEEGVLHHVGLEATHAGFDGWGYVAGWNADGQWVDFAVSTPPGSYVLELRYAAGAGDASRLVFVNGQDLVANQSFPSTGGWDTYATVDVPVTLPATSTVSLVFNGGKGSTGFLNLDRLVVRTP